jgi:hypothetical protein
MKNKTNLIGIGNIVRVLGLMALLAVAAVSSAFAESVTKDFEFGAGTGASLSDRRTFWVPCGLPVTAKVTFSRLGAAAASNDVPIIIELKRPGTTSAQDGPVVASQNATAKRDEQTRTLNGPASSIGCSTPWAVRVRSTNGQSPLAIMGDITVTFDDSPFNINVEGNLITLDKGTSETKKIGGSSGLKQGKIVVTADWNHALLGAPGPLPVRLKFELINPNGQVVATDTGYSGAEINPCCSDDKMKITFRVQSCISGQWKLRITNNTDDDTMNINPKVRFTPDCT